MTKPVETELQKTLRLRALRTSRDNAILAAANARRAAVAAHAEQMFDQLAAETSRLARANEAPELVLGTAVNAMRALTIANRNRRPLRRR